MSRMSEPAIRRARARTRLRGLLVVATLLPWTPWTPWTAWTPCEAGAIGARGRAEASTPRAASKRSIEPAPIAGSWGQWRGPDGTGYAPEADPPVVWDERRNVRWKAAIPGHGHSSPVVWGDRVYVTTAVPFGEAVDAEIHEEHGAHHNVAPDRALRFVVIAYDRSDGSVAWRRTVREEVPHDATHETGTWASASPVTDGEHVVAFFGSAGVFGLSASGEVLWSKDFGDMRVKHSHGEGASPALHGDTVVVNWDHEGDSFVVALDKRTGKERWRATREEGTSWSSPLVVEHAGKPQVVVAATRRIRAYDLATGRLVWECGGLSGNVVATPVAANGILYVGSSYEKRAMLAIRLDRAQGDITGTDAVLWTRDRDTPYVPSPVWIDGMLCFLKHYQGILTCVDGPTGAARVGPMRVPGIGNVYASLVGAKDRIYVFGRDGTTAIVTLGPEHSASRSSGDPAPNGAGVSSGARVRAKRTMSVVNRRIGEPVSATPAIAGDALFVRSERSLYCIAEGREAAD